MATFLVPAPNRDYLTVTEVIDRLSFKFRFVIPNAYQGLAAVALRTRKMHPSATQEELDSLITPLVDSTIVVVTDDMDSDTQFLRSLVVPNEPIQMEWIYPRHQKQCAGLLKRFAEALGYTITEQIEF